MAPGPLSGDSHGQGKPAKTWSCRHPWATAGGQCPSPITFTAEAEGRAPRKTVQGSLAADAAEGVFFRGWQWSRLPRDSLHPHPEPGNGLGDLTYAEHWGGPLVPPGLPPSRSVQGRPLRSPASLAWLTRVQGGWPSTHVCHQSRLHCSLTSSIQVPCMTKGHDRGWALGSLSGSLWCLHAFCLLSPAQEGAAVTSLQGVSRLRTCAHVSQWTPKCEGQVRGASGDGEAIVVPDRATNSARKDRDPVTSVSS